MPVVHVTYSAQEVFAVTFAEARQVSSEIVELADLGVCPLTPGEKVEDRWHRIAKLGKRLAELTVTIDTLITGAAAELAKLHQESAPAQGSDPKPEAN